MTEIPSLRFGANATKLQTSAGPAWVVDSLEDIPLEMRQAAFANRSKDLRYYEVLEATLHEQFEFRCFILYDSASGEWGLQPFFFVFQDLLAGLPQGVRALFNGV